MGMCIIRAAVGCTMKSGLRVINMAGHIRRPGYQKSSPVSSLKVTRRPSTHRAPKLVTYSYNKLQSYFRNGKDISKVKQLIQQLKTSHREDEDRQKRWREEGEGAGEGREEGWRGEGRRGREKGGKEKEILSTCNTEQSSYREMKPKVRALGAPSQALYLAEYIVSVM